MPMNVHKLISRLDGVRSRGHDRWIAKCPAHDDRSPSLSIRETEDGTVLIKCFAGCGAVNVLQAVGLELVDLFPERLGHHRKGQNPGRIDFKSSTRHVAYYLFIIYIQS